MESQDQDALVFHMAVDEECAKEVTDRLVEFNRSHFNMWEQHHDARYVPSPLHIYALKRGRTIGGLIGRTHSVKTWFEISIIWVSKEMRGQGIGQELMRRAEAEALHRGCLYARTSTSHYQAPGFYQKLGYTVYGKLENCPPGETVFYFYKNLS